MKKRYKDILSIAIILVLLPYIITLFMNGKDITVSSAVSEKAVKVQTAAEGGSSVIQIRWEDYLMGILAKETTPETEEAALEVQAVLIRTRLYQGVEAYKNTGAAGKDYIFQEAYWEFEEIEKQWLEHQSKLKKAVRETKNLILTYDGKIAAAPYHQLNNGSTRTGSEVLGGEGYPYLIAKECKADQTAKHQMSMVTLPYEKVGAGVTLEDLEILEKDSAGYAKSIRVGANTYSGEEFRKEFDLASSCLSFQDYHGKLRITTQGIGHGLGVSQYTANEMAEKGKSCEEILKYFFEGINIEDGGEIFSKLE